MAITDPKNTLAYHNSRMLTTHRDMSATPLANVVDALDAYMKADQNKTTVPESEALWFYGMNHGMALIQAKRAPLEPLPAFELDFVEAYHAIIGPKAVRAFYYLLWICNREARHNKSLAKDVAKMEKQFGPECAGFFASIVGGEDKIAQKLLANPPACSVGAFVDCMRWQFYHSHWGSNYGGKKWGVIADCLCAFVNGVASAEVMMDTVWTLSHNCAPIFDKGHFYQHHSTNIVRVLDVQRSGQVPEGVLTDTFLGKFAEPALRSLMTKLSWYFPGALGDYVDWLLVEARGSVNKYPGEINKQVALHGVSAEAQAAQKAAAEAVVKAAEKAEAEAAAAAEHYAKTHFQVMPGVMVDKVELQRAA